MVFFQGVLLLGYCYALALNRLSNKHQLILHSLLLMIVTFSLSFSFPFPLLPKLAISQHSPEAPAMQLLGFLTISIGFPYFLLSTTSIVLQKWHHASFPTQSPYYLYALSNASSLLAIGSYPFLIEPASAIPQQALVWLELFILFSCCMTILGLVLLYIAQGSYRQRRRPVVHTSASLPYVPWLLLSATGSVMLLAVTNVLTQSIAPVPFLWLLPLLLYLLSFVLAFSDRGKRYKAVYPVVFLLITPLCLIVTTTMTLPFVFIAIVFTILLFATFMLCHGMLYDYKPEPTYLDRFYFVTACGGALGGTVVGILAPLLFKDIWEFPLGILCTASIAVVSLVRYFPLRIFSSKKEQLFFYFAILAIASLTAAVLFFHPSPESTTLVSARNFYGVVSVLAQQTPSGILHALAHGKVVHGSQFQAPPQHHLATTYYAPHSGIGRLLQLQQADARPHRVAILGLGTGTLAVYGRPKDQYHFYEINPQVTMFAQKYFTYLRDTSARVTITTADGRLGLADEEAQRKAGYDVLVLDAFSDDAIPVHLLTKEAFTLYLKRLQPGGVIAVNISNTYLDLTPVIANIARQFHLHAVYILSQPDTPAASLAYWALLSADSPLLTHPSIQQSALPAGDSASIPLWTDTYSNVFQVLR